MNTRYETKYQVTKNGKKIEEWYSKECAMAQAKQLGGSAAGVHWSRIFVEEIQPCDMESALARG